jgi:mannosyltransferase
VSTTSSPPTQAPGIRIGLPTTGDVRVPGVIVRRDPRLIAGAVLVALIAVSAVLRSRQLGGELWFNEAIAVGIATRSFGGVLHATHVGGSAPLYYLLLHFWVNAFGDHEAQARALSLLCSLLTIPVAGWAGWSLAGPRAALYAAILFTFSSLFTEYAEQAQPYALLGLLSLLAVVAFLHAFVYRRRRYLWLLVGALEAALYTQGSAAQLVFGLTAGLLVVIGCAPADARRALVRDGALCLLALIVLYIPWLPSTIQQIAHATSPWHYAPLLGADIPGDLVGGERVDATLIVVIVMGIGPLALVKSRRRAPEAIVFWALATITISSIALIAVSQIATPDWVTRYLLPVATVLLLLAALSAARARIVGAVAIVVVVAFCADPGAFAPGHQSDMREVTAQLDRSMHRGDVVAVAQPEQTPLAWYYLPPGFRYESTLGPVSQPADMDWDNAETRLQNAAPAATLGRVVASLRPGQQLLFVRPLTEGGRNWKSSWASLVELRAAQWGQLLAGDVSRGILTPVGTAPVSYPGDCCVADSAVLYRKAS